MAFDPIQEDCLRLILEGMRRDRIYPLENSEYIARNMEAFQRDPAQLIRTDRDRSFHLTAKAALVADYQAPFAADEEERDRQDDIAAGYLQEAVSLDPGNWDARRMLAEMDAETNDAFLTYLRENREAVAHDAAVAVASAQDPYSREYASDLAHRPYLRWMATLASRALISGRYRMALDTANSSLAYAPDDPADVRHTAVLAMAKLEYTAKDISTWRRAHAAAYVDDGPAQRLEDPADAGAGRRRTDPWTLLARLSAAWRSFDYSAADRILRDLLRICPRAPHVLYYQAEFAEGIFSRLNVEPGSEDELMLAVSEATPLLQEGLDAPECAPFSAWISNNERVIGALDDRDAVDAAEHAHGARPWGES